MKMLNAHKVTATLADRSISCDYLIYWQE